MITQLAYAMVMSALVGVATFMALEPINGVDSKESVALKSDEKGRNKTVA